MNVKKDFLKVSNEKEIRDLEVEEMIKEIRKNKSEFAVFLSIELRSRFEDRPAEERHLNFEQWRKLLMLREEKKEYKGKAFTEGFLYASKNNPQKNFRTRMNKEYFNKKGVEVPEVLKGLSTSYLLKMRYSYYEQDFHGVNQDEIYAELANRPHIPTNKEQRRDEQKKRKSSKKDGAAKKGVRSHKSQGRGQSRR